MTDRAASGTLKDHAGDPKARVALHVCKLALSAAAASQLTRLLPTHASRRSSQPARLRSCQVGHMGSGHSQSV